MSHLEEAVSFSFFSFFVAHSLRDWRPTTMYGRPVHRRSASQTHRRSDHPRKRSASPDGIRSPDPTRATKRSSSSPSSSRSSISDLVKEQHPHRRSFSSSSKTLPPSSHPTGSYRLSVAYHDKQLRKSPTIVESVVERLRIYAANRLNNVKEQLSAWKANGTTPFSSCRV